MSSNVPLIQWVNVKCPLCATVATAGWDATAPGPRKLISLSEGFCSIDQGNGGEPEIRCMRCHDTHAACREARSGLPSAQEPDCAA